MKMENILMKWAILELSKFYLRWVAKKKRQAVAKKKEAEKIQIAANILVYFYYWYHVIELNKLRDIWRDPRALAVALTNFQKICGVKVNAILHFHNEDNKERENMQNYFKDLQKIIKDAHQVKVELRDDQQIMMYAMRNIYKFIEIHQQQYNDWEFS